MTPPFSICASPALTAKVGTDFVLLVEAPFVIGGRGIEDEALSLMVILNVVTDGGLVFRQIRWPWTVKAM